MIYHIVLLLAAGLNCIHSASILSEVVNDNSFIKENSQPKIQDDITSSSDAEEKGDILSLTTDSTDNKQSNYEETLNIVLEHIKNPNDQFDLEEPASSYEFNLQDPTDGVTDEIVPPREADYYYNDIINRDPNEIMDTAAGFVPIPIFKRKQKKRKQVAARRRFRNPYTQRRLYYYYPYYSYYRPSSLRFYY